MLKRIRYNSPVVLTFALLSLGALLLSFLTDGVSTGLVFSVYRSSPTDPLTYVRLFCHVLGHSGWEHYISNMTYILLLGPMLEEKYGSRPLLLMICVTALTTGLVFIALFPGQALLGASGVVFMMIVLSSLSSFGQGEIPLTLILVVVLFLGQEIVSGITTADNISQLTHVVGGLVGGLMGLWFHRRQGSGG
ncbi:MAG: rhomboid family intramembrane serine protease [Clostridiales bacterium]|nr:rhomboid family intramembrane serine protease [Clostridiales bacterium]